MTLAFFAIFFLSLLFSFVLTRSVRDFATRHGWVAIPSHERHLHSNPLARLGGVAIFLSFSLSMLVAALIAAHIPGLHSHAFRSKLVATILAPASLVFLLGVYDDLYTVGPYVKFAVQAIAATMLFIGGLRIRQYSGVVWRTSTALVRRAAAHDSVGSRHHQCLQSHRWP